MANQLGKIAGSKHCKLEDEDTKSDTDLAMFQEGPKNYMHICCIAICTYIAYICTFCIVYMLHILCILHMVHILHIFHTYYVYCAFDAYICI